MDEGDIISAAVQLIIQSAPDVIDSLEETFNIDVHDDLEKAISSISDSFDESEAPGDLTDFLTTAIVREYQLNQWAKEGRRVTVYQGGVPYSGTITQLLGGTITYYGLRGIRGLMFSAFDVEGIDLYNSVVYLS